MSGYASYIGRVGALAIALGIGAGVAATPWAASANPSDSGSASGQSQIPTDNVPNVKNPPWKRGIVAYLGPEWGDAIGHDWTGGSGGSGVSGAGGGGGGAIGGIAGGGSSGDQLIAATQNMKEIQMSFNLQHLQLQNSMPRRKIGNTPLP